MPPRNKLPSLRLHKPSGQAVVTLSGRDAYLGPYGTRLSRDNYDRVVGEWLAAGRTPPRRDNDPLFTVAKLCAAFVAAGEVPASHRADYRVVIKLLLRLYGRTAADEFRPLALQAVRDTWVVDGCKRKTANARTNKVRRVFRWGVEKELVAADTVHALDAVRSLVEGKTVAPESVPVEGVDAERVAWAVAAMPPMLADMVRLQHLTGMRAKELLSMRTCDVDTRRAVWLYSPADHKTRRKGKLREVAIGAKAIAVLRPHLLPDLRAVVFSPARAEASRLATMRAARTTPPSSGNGPGRRGGKPRRKRAFADHYTTATYRQAIERVIERQNPPPGVLARQRGETHGRWKARLGPRWDDVLAWRASHRWTPHQLRHAFGEQVREQFGLDHAQVALGHAHARVSEVYAKANRAKSAEVAAAIG